MKLNDILDLLQKDEYITEHPIEAGLVEELPDGGRFFLKRMSPQESL